MTPTQIPTAAQVAATLQKVNVTQRTAGLNRAQRRRLVALSRKAKVRK